MKVGVIYTCKSLRYFHFLDKEEEKLILWLFLSEFLHNIWTQLICFGLFDYATLSWYVQGLIMVNYYVTILQFDS